MAALPPSKMSLSTRCEAGVLELPDNGGFAASVSWSGQPGTRYEESLGVKPKPWFAGVAHDLALCARAYHAGDRQLRGVQHARSSGRGDGERLNFPLSCYVNQPLFWTVLENMSFGELAIKLRSSRELDKALFFGDEWQAGLGEQRMAADLKRQQHAEPQRQQQQHEPAAPARRGQPASGSVPRSSSSNEPQRGAPRVGADAAAAHADAGGGGRGGKAAAPSPPPKQQEKAAAGVDQQPPQQQQEAHHQRRLPAELAKSPPLSPRVARKAVAAHETAAAAAAAAAAAPAVATEPAAAVVAAAAVPAMAAGPSAAATKAAQTNGGPATSSDEDLPLLARKQPKQQAAATPSPGISPGRRAQPAAAKPAGAAAAPRSPRAAKAPQPAAHGQAQQAQEVQQQQEQQAQEQAQQQAAQPAPPRPSKEAEPKTVWAKPAEFPAGSGKYPFYLKEGPLSKGYFTVANEADVVLLGRRTGAVTLRDAATGKSWHVNTSLKKSGASESRYLTATTTFNRENGLRPHDVLWFSAGEPHGQQLVFGVWRWGSAEAAAFKAHLQGSGKPGSGKKRTRAQQQQQQHHHHHHGQAVVSSSSEEDVPLLARRRPQGGRVLSPTTAKAIIDELFEEDDS